MTSDDLGLFAVDDHLIKVVFEKEYDVELFAEAVACVALAPLREDVITRSIRENVDNVREQEWDKNAAVMVCNGPFKVQGLNEGMKLSLERNQYYYRDEEEDALDKSVIPYRIVCYYQNEKIAKGSKSDITEAAYQANRFDEEKVYYLGSFEKATFEKYKEDITTNKLLSTYTYFFNTKNDILKNEKVRQALSAALDRNAIVDAIGRGYIASTGFVPSGVFDTKSGTDFREVGGDKNTAGADPEKAKALLAEAGVRKGSLNLAYLVPATKDIVSGRGDVTFGAVKYENPAEIAAKAAKASWEALGFTVKLVPVYAEDFQSVLSAGDFDIIGVDFALNSTDAMAYLAPFATKFSGNKVSISFDAEAYTPHYTGIQSEEYDNLVEEAMYIKDRAERAAKLHEVETMLTELCPATAVFQYTSSYVYNDDILSRISTNYFGMNMYSDLRMSDYIDINSRETEISVEEAKPTTAG